jgi:uncharacterized RDD family membrane protein YckC
MSDDLQLETTHHYKLAGFWIRWVALILDNTVGGFLMFLSSLFVPDQKENVDIIIAICYFVLIPYYWKGHTLGKRIVKIHIARVDGQNLGMGTLFLREIIGALVYIPTIGFATIISGFMIGLRKDKRAIHDFIAGTHVIHD